MKMYEMFRDLNVFGKMLWLDRRCSKVKSVTEVLCSPTPEIVCHSWLSPGIAMTASDSYVGFEHMRRKES